MPRGGKREGAGRKRMTAEQIYENTYKRKLEKEQRKAGHEDFSTIHEMDLAQFKHSYNVAKMLDPNITPEKFVNTVIKNSRERTINQARSQVKNVREHIKQAKLAAKQGQQLNPIDAIFAQLDPKDFKAEDFYQGSAQVTMLEQLAFNTPGYDYGDVFGS